jgi:predicted site-specific integrase-resolvase
MVSLENQALRRDILEGFLARAFGTIKMGLYARVSTHDQQTLALQRDALVAYAQQRSGAIVTVVEDVGAGGQDRHLRQDKLGFLLITQRYAAIGSSPC